MDLPFYRIACKYKIMPLTDQLRLPLGKLGKLTLGGFWSELTHEEQLLHLPNNFQIVCDKFSHSPQQFSRLSANRHYSLPFPL